MRFRPLALRPVAQCRDIGDRAVGATGALFEDLTAHSRSGQHLAMLGKPSIPIHTSHRARAHQLVHFAK